jgi:uncharacterized membrane protein YgcG
MNTKIVLTLVMLSGMLTGLTATMIQATPVYADTEDCKDNDDDNCNTTKERSLEIEQENNCSADNGNANGGSGDGGGTGGAGGSAGGNDNSFSCFNQIFEPNTGNDAFNSLP